MQLRACWEFAFEANAAKFYSERDLSKRKLANRTKRMGCREHSLSYATEEVIVPTDTITRCTGENLARTARRVKSKHALKKLLSIFVLFACCLSPFAQQMLQSPEQFLPHPYGRQFSPHHLLVAYYEYVAANSPRARLSQYGQTVEHRPLVYMIISSPENLANLDAIRLRHLHTAGLVKGDGRTSDKAILWLSFGVHGNEAAASESALATLYELTRPDRPDVQKWLKNTIVIIDPCLNPDGYSRYTHWHNGVCNTTPDPAAYAREHVEPWPGGRVNHYLFDLNRDWAWQTQKETQQRLEVYHQWMPHIHVDLHEMFHNSPYYFAPAAQPYHNYITKWQAQFQMEIGKNHAKYFDQAGWLYFTREVFDLLYPSYGDTYPTFKGAIGMTYEQGGHSRAGRAIEKATGDTLRLADRILHHVTASLSTLEVCSKNAERLIRNFTNYYQTANEQPPGKYRSYIIKGNNPSGKLKALTALLGKNKIRYGRAKTANEPIKVFDFQERSQRSVKLEADDLVVPVRQAFAVLVQVLFEPETLLTDSLTYDITAWSIPYAFGLNAYACQQDLPVKGDWRPAKKSNPVTSPEGAYAYLFSWNSANSIRLLALLHQANVKVRSASKAFQLDGANYAPGSLIVTRADNIQLAKRFDETVRRIAQKVEEEAIKVESGWSDEGPDLGSGKMKYLEPPRVLLATGAHSSANSFGQVWHYFEQDISYPVTVVEAKRLANVPLDDFEVIILPSGNYSSAIKATTQDRLRDWMKEGGKLIAMGSALSLFEGKAGFGLKRSNKEDKLTRSDGGANALARRLHLYGEQERQALSKSMPGAIFKLRMDSSHPLAFGLSTYYYSLKTSRRAYSFLENGWNVGTVGEEPEVVGFAGAQALETMKNTTVFSVEQIGKGRIVYMVDNPLFRGFWENGKLVFGNAVFLVGAK